MAKKNDNSKNGEMVLRSQVISEMMDQKQNGVRFGTLLIMGICETTREASLTDPAYQDKLDSHEKRIFQILITPKDEKPMYKPDLSDF